MADKATVKNVKGARPVETTMKQPKTAAGELVKSPDLVMQRKLKGRRLIGGPR
jgi:hypothetical protein